MTGISDLEFEMMLDSVTRLEVIDYDNGGRVYTSWRIKNLEFSLQDDGRTLKIFANDQDPGED